MEKQRKLKIWLATVGEPLPIDGPQTRLLRTGQFAEWLCQHGYNVTFLTNTMDHYQRKLRSEETKIVQINDSYKIVMLAGREYKGTKTRARFRHHADVARSFRQIQDQLDPPDVILASYPIEELCREMLDYAKPKQIPVAIDTRDVWPDIFEELFPDMLKPVAKILLYPLERQARQTYARADALSGITQSTLDWGLQKAGRKQHPYDYWFPFSYPEAKHTAPIAHSGLRICFLGTISTRSNLEMAIDAMRILDGQSKNVTLEICGSGAAEEALKLRAANLNNVTFRGWLNKDQILEVMRNSDFGLLPYNRADFHRSLPNKYAEYLSMGLPIFSCTEGEVETHLAQSKAGLWSRPSVNEIVRIINEFDVNLLPELRANAAKVFKREFSHDAVFKKSIDALEKLIKS